MEDKNNDTRMKVNKNTDSQTRILKLRVPYLKILAVYVLISVLVLLSSFSFALLAILALIGFFLYTGVQFLDNMDYLDNFKKSNIPDEFINDLF